MCHRVNYIKSIFSDEKTNKKSGWNKNYLIPTALFDLLIDHTNDEIDR